MVRAINFVSSIRVNVIKNVIESTCVSSMISKIQEKVCVLFSCCFSDFSKAVAPPSFLPTRDKNPESSLIPQS